MKAVLGSLGFFGLASLAHGVSQDVLKFEKATSVTPTIYNSSQPDPQQKCSGYKADHFVPVQGVGFTAELTLKDECNVYGLDVSQLGLSVQYQSDDRLSVQILPTNLKPENETYYLLPDDIAHQGHIETGTPDTSNLVFEHGNQPSFWFRVKRRDTGDVLFSTEGTHIVFENQFIEFVTNLPEGHNLYGLGETVNDFKLHEGTVRTMHNADIPDAVNANLYGTHPFYIEHRYDGGKSRAHGVYLRNAHSQEIKIGKKDLTWRTIGGAIDLYFFAGPSPKEVIRQYQEVVGFPAMHQYWTLGYQHSRWGIESAEELLAVAKRYENASIPLEAMWSDLDYMDRRRDFTVNANYSVERFGKVLNELHDSDRYYIPLVDAAIYAGNDYATYKSGIKSDVFVKNPDGSPFVGQVWPGPCVFPDWLGFNTPNWWLGELSKFHDIVPYDGVWLDMNEVSSFCTANECEQHTVAPNGPYGVFHDGTVAKEPHINARNLRFPPYALNNSVTPNELGGRTMPMENVHAGGIREYDWHNLWGFQICRNTYHALVNEVLPGKRPFLISRSTFAGSGTVAGHWGGDNYAEWRYLRYTITQGLSFSMFGIPMFGTDTCGFHGAPDDHEEMCNRWVQLNSFFSFFRNHNDENTSLQDLYIWDSVADAARKSIGIRYQLLPYMYTLLQNAHTRGDTWLRALSWEFPDDPTLADIDSQFMVGSAIMVVPVLEAQKTQVENAVFPNDRWYDWYTHEEVSPGVTNVDAPLGHIPVYIRGGSILALQEPKLTTAESRKGEWEIVVALDHDGNASGELYLDDGETLQSVYSRSVFSVKNGRLTVSTEGRYQTPKLTKITVLGQKKGIFFNASPKVYHVDQEDWLYNLDVEL